MAEFIAERLAGWAASLSLADLPPAVVQNTKLRLLDAIGVTIAGRATDYGKSLSDAVSREMPRSENSGFRGAGINSAPHLNAFANGALAAALDFDDTHNETVIHPTTPTAAAVLAVAETHPLGGSDVILAIAVGSEICCRIGVGAPGEFHKRGFHPTGVVGAFGAAGGAGKALRLSRTCMINAMGLVASMGSGIMQSWVDGTDARYIHNGHSAMVGLLAAQLAQSGVTGPGSCLEGRYGLYNTHIQDGAALTLDRVTSRLGEYWESEKVSLKPYPTAHVSHSFIDALLYLLRSEKIAAGQIDSIICRVADYMMPLMCEPQQERGSPQTAAAARVSLAHMLAEAAVFEEISARSFSLDRLNDPRVRALAQRVTSVVDRDAPGRERFKGWVQIKLKDGRELERVEEFNWGSADRPMTAEDVQQKFVINVAAQMSEEAARRVAEQVLSLDKMTSLDSFFRSLHQRASF